MIGFAARAGRRLAVATMALAVGFSLTAAPRPAQALGTGAAVGLGLGALVLLHRNLRDAYELRFGARADFTAVRPAQLGPGTVLWIGLIGLERTYVFWIVLAGALGAFELLLDAVAVYVVGVFVGAVWLTFRATLARDRSKRDGSG